MKTDSIVHSIIRTRDDQGQLQRLRAFILAMFLSLFGVVLAGCSPERVSGPGDAEPAIVGIIQSIERGWEHADAAPFRENFLDFPGARYIEGGGQNQGLSDLVDHHVIPEGDALDDFDLNFSNIEVHEEGSFAWAIADVDFSATVKSDGRHIQSHGYETFLLRFVDGQWKVVHTHSSSRPVEANSKHDEH